MENEADLLTLSGIMYWCEDCSGDRVFVPVVDDGEYCCTVCDAAVFILAAFGTLAGSGGSARNVA